jgi:bacillolysin
MRAYVVGVTILVCTAAEVLMAQGDRPAITRVTLAATSGDARALRDVDRQIDTLQRSGGLQLRVAMPDTVIEGRVHERYDQYWHGVRVIGGDVVRQVHNGVTESVFGSIYQRIDVSTTPRLSEDQAREAIRAVSNAALPSDRPVELVVVAKDGVWHLAWRTHVWSAGKWLHTFVDADTGALVRQYNDLQKQSAVGVGTGVLGDRKKISVRQSGSQYVADDQLRPPVLATFDMHGSPSHANAVLDGAPTTASDFASDADNTWTDGANVDAHVHLGWTYDYWFRRFGRKGLDDHDAPIRSMTHPVNRADLLTAPDEDLDFYLNAFWCEGCGPNGQGIMMFGEGLPDGYVLSSTGQYVDYFAGALDIVAHEVTHGLTDRSSQLIYENESGALNEAFSDIIGTSTEFFYQTPGSGPRQADYLIGEDVVTPGGIRSLSNPQSFGDPDHYSRRFLGPEDNGGVHINSTIVSHAFYLAIEGGTNRTSGASVQGVGAANREQMEKVFYRAFVFLLPSDATFSTARAATIQAARDLFGSASGAERAVTEAWTAVGVN